MTSRESRVSNSMHSEKGVTCTLYTSHCLNNLALANTSSPTPLVTKMNQIVSRINVAMPQEKKTNNLKIAKHFPLLHHVRYNANLTCFKKQWLQCPAPRFWTLRNGHERTCPSWRKPCRSWPGKIRKHNLHLGPGGHVAEDVLLRLKPF